MRVTGLVFVLLASAMVRADINGTVVDDETGKPIEQFSLILRPGEHPERTIWQQHTIKTFSHGTFSLPHPRGWKPTQVRVWATGYRPDIANVAETDDRPVEFRLRRDEPIVGKVLTNDGKPLAGAKVALMTTARDVFVNNGELSLAGSASVLGAQIITTGDDGSFAIPSEIERARVIVVHETGYAEADLEALRKPLVLSAWATIEGRLMLGRKLGADWTIMVNKGGSTDRPSGHFWIAATTDAAGKFTCKHVPSGRVTISPAVKTASSTCHVTGTSAIIDVVAGQTIQVTLGGEGRPVIGRLVAANGANVNWRAKKLLIRTDAPHIGFPGDQEMWDAQGKFFNACEGVSYHDEVTPAADGTFRFERLPQGEYNLGGWGIDARKTRVIVPPMDAGISDEPLDLGELSVIRP